ncbi:MAG: Uma2 family endonuclease [Microcystis aeruginosa W11-06]|nr:Uma2 family endonuclease [Microcystis aeruginosa W11-06]
METVVLNLETVNLTDEQFYHLCQANQTWNLERNQKGELLIMPPVGGNSGNREAELIADVTIWNRQSNSGKVFSSTDSLTSLREKMREYLASGLRLGWLINPQQQQVEIYRLNSSVEIINLPAILSGEDVLPGLVLHLT